MGEGARVELSVVVDEVGVGKEEEPLCVQLARLYWRRHPIRHLHQRALTTALNLLNLLKHAPLTSE